MDIQVRCFRPGDEDTAWEIYTSSTAPTTGPRRWLDKRAWAEFRSPIIAGRPNVGFYNSREKNFTHGLALVAESGETAVGYALLLWNQDGLGTIAELCVADPFACAVQRTLLQASFAALSNRGVHTAYSEYASHDDRAKQVLQNAGCLFLPKGNVCMMKVQHLRDYLKQIAGVLQQRVDGSDHSFDGTVALSLGEQTACVVIEGGRVSIPVCERKAGIHLTGSYEAMTQILVGARTVESAYKNAEVDIEPKVTFDTLFFLNDLFPAEPWSFPHQVEN